MFSLLSKVSDLKALVIDQIICEVLQFKALKVHYVRLPYCLLVRFEPFHRGE